MKGTPGFLLSGVSAGLKKGGEKDLALIFSRVPAATAALFTKNLVKAAPVLVGRERIAGGLCQAIVANSANANACTGDRGYEDSLAVAAAVSKKLGIDESLVIPSSTGVIGKRLPAGKIARAVPRLVRELGENNSLAAAEAIMTTDAFAKYGSRKISLGKKTATLSAIAKGAGMICPDMATMLCFVTTDVGIGRKALARALETAAAGSFNAITVDGDTSTNDSVFVMANGVLGNAEIAERSRHYGKFAAALSDLCAEMAEMIVRDGEGATKTVRIHVREAGTEKDAERVARTVANSQLVKTAFYGEDPNWGRIVAAAGRAGRGSIPGKWSFISTGRRFFRTEDGASPNRGSPACSENRPLPSP